VHALEICVHRLVELDEIYRISKLEARQYWLRALSNRGLLNDYSEYMEAQSDEVSTNSNTGDNDDGDSDDDGDDKGDDEIDGDDSSHGNKEERQRSR
jgi:hypothetical protein